MLVREILGIKGSVLYTIAPSATLAEAVGLMSARDIGSLVVVEAGALRGMLTFREVLSAVQAAGANWQARRVSDVMMVEPRAVPPDMEVDELRRQMIEHHQRYLPVMESGALLGVLSFHDVAKAVLEAQSFENRMLKDYIRNWPDEEGDAVPH